jgi:MULE transposase domain/FAR1 DNA-binding domain
MTLSLAPPPTTDSYESVSDALKALNAFAAAEGYAIIKRRSKSWGGMMRRVILKCDKGGKKRKQNPAHTERKRSKSSRLTNCPFSMDLYLEKEEVHWKIHLHNGNHNHTATKAIAHPTHRQLDSPRRRKIERQCDANIAPRQTHTSLLLDSNSTDGNKPVLLSDINNARYRYRALRQGPRTAIQALINGLQEGSWYCQYQTDNSNAIRCCFFAYQKSIHLFQRFSEVVLIDCTYNTNKFNIPLFIITGRTSMNRSFTIRIAFLAGETFEDFQ